jgi:hypothetical protein
MMTQLGAGGKPIGVSVVVACHTHWPIELPTLPDLATGLAQLSTAVPGVQFRAMNKVLERRILDSVYAGLGLDRVSVSESPDFLCRASPSCEFGVEIAEFFYSESAARLRRIPGYTMELLETGVYRHKDDKSRIPVDDVTIFPDGDKEKGITWKAVVGEVRTIPKVVERIVDLIRTKNQKCTSYKAHINPVDLVVYDADGAASFVTHDEILRPFYGGDSLSIIVESPFREIHLITRTKGRHVRVPLKTNIFVSEIWTFREAFMEFHKERLAALSVRDYLMPLARYLAGFFPGVEYGAGPDGVPVYTFGCVTCHQKGGAGPMEVTDITTSDEPRHKLKGDVEGSLDSNFAEFLQVRRSERYYFFNICLPTDIVEIESG